MLRLTVAGLLAHRLRLLLTAVTIAIGAALVAGTFILTDSVRGALSASTATASGAAAFVQPAGAAGGKGAGPLTSLPASLAARISAVRGAASAEGLVTASKITLIGKNGRPVTHQRASPIRPCWTRRPRAASVTASAIRSASSPRPACRA
jgi:putative ABC transport system permease protein